MYLHTGRDTMSFLRATELQESIIGFEPGRKTLLSVRYDEMGKTVYHSYEGGSIWMATVPRQIGGPGATFAISAKVLTTNEFVDRIPEIGMVNSAGFTWLPEISRVSVASARGLRLRIRQSPPIAGLSTFQVPITPATNLGFAPGLGCFLEARIVDLFGRERKLRLYHNGHSTAWLGLRQGRRYPRVSLLSSDGIRFRIVYGSPEMRIATIYLQDPAALYSIHESPEVGVQLGKLKWNPLRCYSAQPRRQLETDMLRSRHRYPHGRVGSEVAYAIANRDLSVSGLILNDPSEDGPDMVAEDGRVIFENRLLTITEAMTDDLLQRQIEFQMGRLKARLASDLSFYSKARMGYAFLSFVDSRGLKTLLFELRKR